MVTNEITKDNKTLLICYKDSYPCGQILYNGSKWVYITSVDVNKVNSVGILSIVCEKHYVINNFFI
jgi:hypothetical protein